MSKITHIAFFTSRRPSSFIFSSASTFRPLLESGVFRFWFSKEMKRFVFFVLQRFVDNRTCTLGTFLRMLLIEIMDAFNDISIYFCLTQPVVQPEICKGYGFKYKLNYHYFTVFVNSVTLYPYTCIKQFKDQIQ